MQFYSWGIFSILNWVCFLWKIRKGRSSKILISVDLLHCSRNVLAIAIILPLTRSFTKQFNNSYPYFLTTFSADTVVPTLQLVSQPVSAWSPCKTSITLDSVCLTNSRIGAMVFELGWHDMNHSSSWLKNFSFS